MAILFETGRIRLTNNRQSKWNTLINGNGWNMQYANGICKALRIVTKSGWYQNALPLYQKFNLLNLQNLHKFETAKFIHNHINQRLSPNFNNYFTLAKFSHSRQTRSTASLNLIIPLYKTKRTQQSIKYSGAKIWNYIPNNTKDLSFRKFLKESKEILLNSFC